MDNFGFIAAIGAALAWGTYIVPFKKSKTTNLMQFQVIMCLGIFGFALIVSPILGYSINLNFYGLAAGFMWAIGNVMSLSAVENLGISKAMPLWVSVIILTSVLWGSLVFHESVSPGGIGGIVLIIIGVILVGMVGEGNSKNIKKGIALALLSGIIFGAQLTPLKLGHLSAQVFFFPMSLGIVLTGLAIGFVNKVDFEKKGAVAAAFSGGIWSLGNLLGVIAVSILGLAKGTPVTQSAVLIAVLWGLFYFKEIPQLRQRIQVLIGALILLSGVIMLGLA